MFGLFLTWLRQDSRMRAPCHLKALITRSNREMAGLAAVSRKPAKSCDANTTAVVE